MARTEMWSQPPWKGKAMSPRGPVSEGSTNPLNARFQLVPPRPGTCTMSPAWPTHADAVVPALPFGLPGLHASAMTHGPPAQAMGSLDFVGNDPDLEHTPAEAPAQPRWVTGTGGLGQQGSRLPGHPTPCLPTWSRGPTDTLRTLLDTCSQLEPCG